MREVHQGGHDGDENGVAVQAPAVPPRGHRLHGAVELRAGPGERAGVRRALEFEQALRARRRGGVVVRVVVRDFDGVDFFVVGGVAVVAAQAFVAQNATGRKRDALPQPLPEQFFDGVRQLLQRPRIQRVAQLLVGLRVARLVGAVAFVVGRDERDIADFHRARGLSRSRKVR
ncbi:MAG: hypothetical protein BRD52_06475 [Bacteroidetes bacterium SW_4_67_19]|nr:MAG: hypothetical protein BRD52_06475 [Bacteroidetes bacterium SW_4_67_19]